MRSRGRRRSPRPSRPPRASSCGCSHAALSVPARGDSPGTDAAAQVPSRTAVRTACTSRRPTGWAGSTCTHPSRLGAELGSSSVLLASLTSSLTSFVRDHGIYAVFVLMLIDAVLPAASELVMLVGGAVAGGALGGTVSLFGADISRGFWSYVAISIAGTTGYLAGSVAGWWIGRYGGRPLLEQHGRWF